MYIPETVIFIKSAKLDAQKHWQITVEMKSFILEQGFDKDYLHVKGKSEQKGEESTNHTSYSVLRDRMGGIHLSDERLYAVVNFIEKINIC